MTELKKENPYKDLEFEKEITDVTLTTKNGEIEIPFVCPDVGQISDAKKRGKTEEEIEYQLVNFCTNIPINVIRRIPPKEYEKLQKALMDFLPESFKQNQLISALQNL